MNHYQKTSSIAILLIILNLPLTASTIAPPSPSRVEQARHHYINGLKLEFRGKYDEAIHEFEESMRLNSVTDQAKVALSRVEAEKYPNSGQKPPSDYSQTASVDLGQSSPSDAAMPTGDLLSKIELENVLTRGLYGTPALQTDADNRIRKALSPSDVVTIKYVYYPVVGHTPSEIDESTKTVSAKYVGGGYEGLTSTNYNYHWGVGTNGRVFITKVNLTETVTLPQWTPAASDDPTMSSEMTRSFNVLKFHELGHVLVAEAMVAAFENQVRDLPSGSTLVQVKEAASQTSDAYDKYQEDYDRITEHGIKQDEIYP